MNWIRSYAYGLAQKHLPVEHQDIKQYSRHFDAQVSTDMTEDLLSLHKSQMGLFFVLIVFQRYWVPSTSFTPLTNQFTVIDGSHGFIASSHGCEDIIWIFFIWDLNPSLKWFLWVLRQKTLDSISCLLLLHFYLLTNFTPCCPDILNFKMKKIDWPKTCIDSCIEKSKISRILCKHLSKNLNLIFVERAFLHFTLFWRIPISPICLISLSLL